MIGKAIGAVFVAAIAFGALVSLMPKDMRAVVNGPPTHASLCHDRISSKMPDGGFVVMSTDPERFPDGERSAIRIDVKGIDADMWCWTGPKGQIELRTADGPPSWSDSILTHDRNGQPVLIPKAKD